MDERRALRLIWLAVLLLLALRLAAMGIMPLMDTTEARYGEIARKMAQSGDWVVPWHDRGVPFWGKPPLSFWLSAISFELFGVSEWAARLPHLLCNVLIAAFVWDLARKAAAGFALEPVGVVGSTSRHSAPLAGALAVLVLSACPGFFISSGAVMTDEALVLGMTAAIYGFWMALFSPDARQRRLCGWLFFVALAFGLLAKGPLVLVLVGAPLFLWTLWGRQWGRVWQGLPWLRGTVLMLALALPWYGLAEQRSPGFLEYFILGEHVQRFITPGWKGDLYGTAHLYPRGTIWVFLLLMIMPWPLLLAVLAWLGRRRPAAPAIEGPAAQLWPRYLALWAVMPVVFFTPARNIIWTYVLPALPACALIVTALMRRYSPRPWPAALAAAALVFGGALAGGTAALRSGELDRASARQAVQQCQQARGGGLPAMVFVGLHAFSSDFYTGGQAIRIAKPEDLARHLPAAGACVLLRPTQGPVVQAQGHAQVLELGLYPGGQLLWVRP
jgi:4-amino-4-deoxy-L-arabinose transferase-like glycosyltransferase